MAPHKDAFCVTAQAQDSEFTLQLVSEAFVEVTGGIPLAGGMVAVSVIFVMTCFIASWFGWSVGKMAGRCSKKRGLRMPDS